MQMHTLQATVRLDMLAACRDCEKMAPNMLWS